ncbi:MAG: flagellar hook-associated protein FlgL [Pseudomonadota bacterium]
MNRISTSQLFTNTLSSISGGQARLAELQRAIASGKQVNTAADDPVGAGRILELRALTERITQYSRNSDAAEARLSTTENALVSASDSLNRVRELALASVNGINTPSTLEAYGQEVLSQLESLIALANQADANGEYLFSGTASNTLPFTLSGTLTYNYFGNSQSRSVSISDNQTVAMGLPGDAVFIDIPTGNGRFQVVDAAGNTGTAVAGDSSISDPSLWVPDDYTLTFIDPTNWEVRDSGGVLVQTGTYAEPGTISFRGADLSFIGTPAAGDQFLVETNTTQDIFTTLDELGAALNGETPLTETALANLLNRSLNNIDNALGVNQDSRATLGVRLSSIDSYRDLNARDVIQAQTLRSSIEDLDYAAAISEFEYESTILEAAQQTFLSLQNLSLFRLL